MRKKNAFLVFFIFLLRGALNHHNVTFGHKTVNIPFAEAYGPSNPEMIVDMPKDRFPADMQIEVGMPLVMSDGQGQQFQVKIVEIKEESVMLDANHPLAGKDLIFDLELVEIAGGSPLIITP